MRLGVVIPTYRESENIVPLVDEIIAHVPAVSILVVDDSPDTATADAVRGANRSQARVIHRAIKGGRGSAVLDGIRELLAEGCDGIVEMDADFSHPPSQIPELVAFAQKTGSDLVIGSRYVPHGKISNWPISRRILSRGANFLARRMLGVPIRDYTSGFRLYSRAAAETILATCGKLGRGFIPLSEIVVNLHYRGFRLNEVPLHFVNRARGESSLDSRELRDAIVGLWKISRLKRQLKKSAQ